MPTHRAIENSRCIHMIKYYIVAKINELELFLSIYSRVTMICKSFNPFGSSLENGGNNGKLSPRVVMEIKGIHRALT